MSTGTTITLGGLAGRRAIVTGSSSGIGRAIALALAAAGVRVVGAGRDRTKLDALQDEAPAGTMTTLALDLAGRGAADELVAIATAQLGGLDILVNSAGESPYGTLDDVGADDWQRAIDVKLIATAALIRLSAPHLAEGGGRVLNIVGTAGRRASPSYVLGCVNAALLHLTRSAGELYAARGITVNALNPGLTLTPRTERAMSALAADGRAPEEALERYVSSSIPLGRAATVDEVATFALFLLSDHASFATGSSFTLDGGASRGVVG
ncbi:MAG: SDR family oxidoreductase [Actinomycetota bacterium]